MNLFTSFQLVRVRLIAVSLAVVVECSDTRAWKLRDASGSTLDIGQQGRRGCAHLSSISSATVTSSHRDLPTLSILSLCESGGLRSRKCGMVLLRESGNRPALTSGTPVSAIRYLTGAAVPSLRNQPNFEMEKTIEKATARARNMGRRLMLRLHDSSLLLCSKRLFNTEICKSFRQTTEGKWFTALVSVIAVYLILLGSLSSTASLDALIIYDDVYVSDAAERLPKKGRLLCFVITSPKFYNSRVPAIHETWLSRCDHGQFFGPVEMAAEIPHTTVLSAIPDDYDYLFQKTLVSLHYAYTQISDQFDWYYKADDDTYVVMEHMYDYLATLDPNKPYYLGYRLKPHLPKGYNGGGAGYVLSRAAVKLFLEQAFHDRTLCPIDMHEDVGMGRCLENIGIYPHDTRNERGQQRFHTYRPEEMFYGAIADEWHYYPQIVGHDWIADDLISLHHLNPNEIRIYDDLIYRMRSPQLSMAKNSVNNVSSEKENGEPNSIPTPSPFLQLKSWKVDNSRKGS